MKIVFFVLQLLSCHLLSTLTTACQMEFLISIIFCQPIFCSFQDASRYKCISYYIVTYNINQIHFATVSFLLLNETIQQTTFYKMNTCTMHLNYIHDRFQISISFIDLKWKSETGVEYQKRCGISEKN